ncbi:hypothetical protein, partial [Streptomyces niveus]
ASEGTRFAGAGRFAALTAPVLRTGGFLRCASETKWAGRCAACWVGCMAAGLDSVVDAEVGVLLRSWVGSLRSPT